MILSRSARLARCARWSCASVRLLAAIFLMLPCSGAGADTAPGTWSTLAPAPTKRTEVAAAAVGDKVYVVGGFAEPALSNITNLAITTAVEVYDPETDRWAAKAPLPVGLHHTGIAVIGRQLYVVGGFTRSLLSVWSSVASLYRYDPTEGSWTELASMPTARGALAVAVVDGKLLAIGGYDGERNTGAVELYDPAANRWITRAPLPTPRDHLAAVAVGEQVYAIGGRLHRDYHHNLATTERYEPAFDRWTRVADLPTARSGITAGVIGGIVYVLGGEAPSGTFATNEAYDPKQDRWRTMAPMPTARHGLGSAVVNDRLYVISGGPSPGGSFSNVNERFTPPVMQSGGPEPSSPATRAAPAHVRAIMTLLQTFQDAGALPPEGTPEADRIIKALIQFQAALIRSEHPAIVHVRDRAFAEAFGSDAPSELAAFRRDGWNARSLEAVVVYAAEHPVWRHQEFAGLAEAFAAFNVGQGDLERVTEVVQTARRHLAARGQELK